MIDLDGRIAGQPAESSGSSSDRSANELVAQEPPAPPARVKAVVC